MDEVLVVLFIPPGRIFPDLVNELLPHLEVLHGTGELIVPTKEFEGMGRRLGIIGSRHPRNCDTFRSDAWTDDSCNFIVSTLDTVAGTLPTVLTSGPAMKQTEREIVKEWK